MNQTGLGIETHTIDEGQVNLIKAIKNFGKTYEDRKCKTEHDT